MDARRRLFALLVALLCAMGWAPTASARGDGDRIVSSEARGVLPARPSDAPAAEPTAATDHQLAGLPPQVVAVPEAAERPLASGRRIGADRRVVRRSSPAEPRGPPAMG